MISAVDNNIIWEMSGACLVQHLGHIVNNALHCNGQQSAVLHASVMPFFKPKLVIQQNYFLFNAI